MTRYSFSSIQMHELTRSQTIAEYKNDDEELDSFPGGRASFEHGAGAGDRTDFGRHFSERAPPELPVYDQPPIPADGYIWTPGYWAWSGDEQDYYWVPGTWVEAPQPGYLWTPGYWGSDGGPFVWHAGYWGTQVGFYGGVNYGYGYGGRGYEGGYWQGDHMYYNRSVVNVGSTHITNVYNKTVINNVTVNRVSYNGGNGGVRAQATPAEVAAGRERHLEPTAAQQQHVQQARSNPQLRLSENKGRPAIAATPRPGNFSGPGVVGVGRGSPAARAVEPNRQPNRQPQQPVANGQSARGPGADRDHGVSEPAARPVQTPRPQVAQPPQVNRPQPEQRPQPERETQSRSAEQVTQPHPQPQQPHPEPQQRAPEPQQHAPAPQQHAPAPPQHAEPRPPEHDDREHH